MEGEEHRQVELEDGVKREEHEHARARDAAEGLVDLPPPAVGLVDVEEERVAVDAPVIIALELAVLVRGSVSELPPKRDQDVCEEGGNSNRPNEDHDERVKLEESVVGVEARDRVV